ncbi:hypothetical protein EUTSA_v10029531mg [Eutrema salsugineum]|uniref:Uncharacterized protein n=1 Tax=Eutrema salsugineum TaxID=72664 RepID=V4L3K6_EUTSA|nr:hypothetical protein EUTSA_v10029531mg [Eutrema salsugineum]
MSVLAILEQLSGLLRTFLLFFEKFICKAGLSMSMIGSIASTQDKAACIPFTHLPAHGIFITRIDSSALINSNMGRTRNQFSWQRRKETSFSCLQGEMRSHRSIN